MKRGEGEGRVAENKMNDCSGREGMEWKREREGKNMAEERSKQQFGALTSWPPLQPELIHLRE